MLTLQSDLNFPWEQQQYIKIYKSFGTSQNWLHYRFITKNNMQSCLLQIILISGTIVEIQYANGEMEKQSRTVPLKWFGRWAEKKKKNLKTMQGNAAVTSLITWECNMSVSTRNVSDPDTVDANSKCYAVPVISFWPLGGSGTSCNTTHRFLWWTC